jgi:hypothetical protein
MIIALDIATPMSRCDERTCKYKYTFGGKIYPAGYELARNYLTSSSFLLLSEGIFCEVLEFFPDATFSCRWLHPVASLRDILVQDAIFGIPVLEATRSVASLSFSYFSVAEVDHCTTVIRFNRDIAARCVRLDLTLVPQLGSGAYFVLIPLLEEVEHE